MRITVIGAGYAGLVTAAGFAELGNDVACVERDPDRVATLRAGRSPMYEPGLDGLLAAGSGSGRLRFLLPSEAGPAHAAAEAVFIVVGTPRLDDGGVDLSQVWDVVGAMAPDLSPGVTVVVKSTVPVGTTREVGDRLASLRPELRFHMASNPEFLRQGAAVADFLGPDRIVVGVDDDAAAEAMRHAYGPQVDAGVPFMVTAIESAELIKYAANAFLATKLSFINEMADLCEASGAVIDEVAAGLGMDRRIGPAFLKAGPGFGGACLPKDTHALRHTSDSFGTGSRIVGAALSVNEERVHRMLGKVEAAIGAPIAGKKIGVLGITFKAETDDVRESPAVEIVREMVAAGASVRVFDPQGMDRGRSVLPEEVEYAFDAYDAVGGADAAVIATEWQEFAALDLERLAAVLERPVLVDFRNLVDPARAAAAGLSYAAIGRRPV